MNASVAKSTVHTQNNNGVLPLLGAARTLQPTNNSGVDQLWFHGCVVRAIKRILSHKEAAFLLGFDKGNLSRVFDAQGGLDVRKLGVLGEDFAIALRDELNTFFGLDNDEERLARAFDAMGSALSTIREITTKVRR